MSSASFAVWTICTFTVGACFGVMVFTAILIVAFKRGLVPDRDPHSAPHGDC